MQVRFRGEAAQDVRDAYEWYQDQLQGLGDEFLEELETLLERIADFPFSAPVVHREVRQRIMPRFPHKVLYAKEPDYIVVIAVFHPRRSPQTWRERVDD